MPNLSYNTQLPNSPPIYPMGRIAAPPIPSYGAGYEDNMRSIGDSLAADYAVNAEKIANNYALQQQQQQQSLALAGLTQMSNEQQAQNEFRNAYLGSVSPLLQGLFS